MKIYLSSTQKDLVEQRKAVIEALQLNGHQIVAMEGYTADERRPVDKCLADVAASDIYVGLVAWRYGHRPAGDKSITEMEYEQALACDLPRYLFLLDEDASWRGSDFEHGEANERVAALRQRWCNEDTTADFFSDTQDLVNRVTKAVADAVLRLLPPPPIQPPSPAQGPRRSSTHIPNTGPAQFGREHELALLDEAWKSSRTNVVSVVGLGGMGKTALLNTWLGTMAADQYRGAEAIYEWSFYGQGREGEASADLFFAEALRWFGDPEAARRDPHARGRRLAELACQERTLLVLDGLETLQSGAGDWGSLRDEAMHALLQELSLENPGLCVTLSRLRIADLRAAVGSTVLEILLAPLSPEAGVALLRELGVKGNDDELRQACEELDGHALSVDLLGHYVVEALEGDIRGPGGARLDLGSGGQVNSLMVSYEEWLGEGPERDILRLLGLFQASAPGGALEALRDPDKPAIPGLTDNLCTIRRVDWNRAVSCLRRLGLIAEPSLETPDALDTHPLVRQHFGKTLQETAPEAWREGNDRLFEFYRSLPETEYPDTLEDMSALFHAVAHGCQAGRHQEAWDGVFWPRVRREDDDYSGLVLGAFGADLAALANFFEECWDRPVQSLDAVTRGRALSEAAFDLRCLGRLDQAIPTLRRGLDQLTQVESWWSAGDAAGNLGEILVVSGRLRRAADAADESIRLARLSGDRELLAMNVATLADALHQSGDLATSAARFQEAEQLYVAATPGVRFLRGLRGYAYCDLLLTQGETEAVKVRAQASLQVDQERGLPHGIGLAYLAMARAHLVDSRASADFSMTLKYLEQALHHMRRIGISELIVRALLAGAEIYRVAGQLEEARRVWREAHASAVRGQMSLHRADADIENVYLCLAEKNQEEARQALPDVYGQVRQMRYGRRLPEMQTLASDLQL